MTVTEKPCIAFPRTHFTFLAYTHSSREDGGDAIPRKVAACCDHCEFEGAEPAGGPALIPSPLQRVLSVQAVIDSPFPAELAV